MTAPALARDRSGRRYVWPPKGDPELVVPSVTTILNQLSKPALVNWAARAVAEYAVEEILNWQNLQMSDAIDLLKRAPYRTMTKRMEIGSAVHAAIDSWQGGEPVVEDLELLPYVAGAISFMDDLVEKVEESEVTLFNRAYRYAGTCDVIAMLKDGRRAICDWKTGKGVYPESALQLCAYANCEFIGRMDGTEDPLPTLDVGLVVHLKDDASYEAYEVKFSPRMFKTFVALRTCQVWREDHEQTALGKRHRGPEKEDRGGKVVRLKA